MNTHDDTMSFLASRGKGKKPGVLDLEKLDCLMRRFADVEEFLKRKLSQLSFSQR